MSCKACCPDESFPASWPSWKQTPTIYSMDMRRWCVWLRLPQSEAIVSGDAHLLGIGEFRGIPIITPAVAVSRLEV
jgi:hypothetical protein